MSLSFSQSSKVSALLLIWTLNRAARTYMRYHGVVRVKSRPESRVPEFALLPPLRRLPALHYYKFTSEIENNSNLTVDNCRDSSIYWYYVT